jgi:DNA-binding NarL/FixJ family response regulator
MDCKGISGVNMMLSKRETEIVSLITEGLSNKEIAERLYLTESTVKSYITNILTKLNLKNRRKIMIHFILRDKTHTKEDAKDSQDEKLPTKGGII